MMKHAEIRQDKWSDFESLLSTRGTFRCELRNCKDHLQRYDFSTVSNLSFQNELAASNDRNFKFTALRAIFIAEMAA